MNSGYNQDLYTQQEDYTGNTQDYINSTQQQGSMGIFENINAVQEQINEPKIQNQINIDEDSLKFTK